MIKLKSFFIFYYQLLEKISNENALDQLYNKKRTDEEIDFLLRASEDEITRAMKIAKRKDSTILDPAISINESKVLCNACQFHLCHIYSQGHNKNGK